MADPSAYGECPKCHRALTLGHECGYLEIPDFLRNQDNLRRERELERKPPKAGNG